MNAVHSTFDFINRFCPAALAEADRKARLEWEESSYTRQQLGEEQTQEVLTMLVLYPHRAQALLKEFADKAWSGEVDRRRRDEDAAFAAREDQHGESIRSCIPAWMLRDLGSEV